ncbi:hypothetical protein HDV00_012099 [Rhizophlyctis rosea]|nr:hypothetical protein HDV00_012099 [Rhizophlyctis rosea]
MLTSPTVHPLPSDPYTTTTTSSLPSTPHLLRALNQTISSLKNSLFDIRLNVPALFTAPLSFLEQLAKNVGSLEAVEGIVGEGDIDGEDGQVERMLGVVRWWLASLEVFDGEQKKPFAPVFGEQFCCEFVGEGGEGEGVRFYAEQISTHPPQSAICIKTADARVKINGIVAFEGAFAGTSMRFTNKGTVYVQLERFNEEYKITPPNFSLRGLLTGTLHADLSSNTCRITCPKSQTEAIIDFPSKGLISSLVGSVGSGVKGRILRKGKVVRKVEGDWRGVMTVSGSDGKQEDVLLDRTARAGKGLSYVPVELEDVELQSRRIWTDLTTAILSHDQAGVARARRKVDEFETLREKDVGNGKYVGRVLKVSEGGRVELVGGK